MYRTCLQTVLDLRPATINRHLGSLKRYFGWAVDAGLLARDPSRLVKLIVLGSWYASTSPFPSGESDSYPHQRFKHSD